LTTAERDWAGIPSGADHAQATSDACDMRSLEECPMRKITAAVETFLSAKSVWRWE
jgi:hypothetical protein